MSDAGEDDGLTFSLDARALKAWIDAEDGDLVLHLSDGQQHVVLEPGAGGSAEDAIAAVRRLVEIAQQFLGLLERARPVDWWTPPEVSDRSQLA